MAIYYPSLNEFWPAVRARNFVKKLGMKPGNYTKNMEILAERAGVDVKEMWCINPLIFAEREIGRDICFGETFCKDQLISILGKHTYAYLDKDRYNRWRSNYEPQMPPVPVAPVAPEHKMDAAETTDAADAADAAEAHYKLAYSYDYGKGVIKDKAAAIHWYTIAAKEGDPRAKIRLNILSPPKGAVVVNLGYCGFTLRF